MPDPLSIRPDGRQPPLEVLSLREKTRALRVHLDDLPIDFNLDVRPEHFLAGLAFMSARQRYSCAESLIGAGFGGTALGSISRSLFVNALRWLWIGADAERLTMLNGDLLHERSGLCDVLEREHCTCPKLRAWLEPLSGIMPLTSPTESPSLAMPAEGSLLANLVNQPARDPTVAGDSLMQRAAELMGGAELRGAALVLAHAGHGNYLGLQSSLAEDSAIGHDLRFDHEALFMQVAGAGVVASTVASSSIAEHWWPDEVPRIPYLERALDLAKELSDAALLVHRLATRSRSAPAVAIRAVEPVAFTPNPTSTIKPPVAWGQSPYPSALMAAAEEYYEAVRSWSFDPWVRTEQTLHSILSWTGALSNLESVFATYDQPGAGIISPFAARALLEEAARTHWRFTEPDENAFRQRATQFFDEFRARRIKTINLLIGGGVPRSAAEDFLALPSYVDPSTISSTITPGRVPIPSITEMLHQLSAQYPEPGWMTVAYSLLSQATHATPLGDLHLIGVDDRGMLSGGTISNEILGLSVDTACTSSAVILGLSALLFSEGSQDAVEYRNRLTIAGLKVHDAARLVHGLD